MEAMEESQDSTICRTGRSMGFVNCRRDIWKAALMMNAILKTRNSQNTYFHNLLS